MKPYFGSNKPKVILKKGKAKPFWFHHPWIFSGAIQEIKGNTQNGDLVDVFEDSGKFIGKGFINQKSQIAVRLLTWDIHEKIDPEFFHRKIAEAIRLRENVLAMSSVSSAYRLIHSEADGLPGLTVDRYNDLLCVQFLSIGMDQRRDLIVDVLRQEAHAATIVEKYSPGVRQREGLEEIEYRVYGPEPPEKIVITEYGLQFEVSLRKGQKTGFYLDQRENRRKLSRYGHQKRILDGFCYSGGFGIYLATKSKVTEVVFMDSSAPALELAQANWKLNQLEGTKSAFIKADIFEKLVEMKEANERFDLIILDPPKVAPDTASLKSGLESLEKINRLGIQILNPGGILVSCDCSGLISWDVFLKTLNKAALDSNRGIKIFDCSSAGPDHPVNPACPENAYLKVVMSEIS